MSEGPEKIDVAALARAGVEQQEKDRANPEYGAKIDRVLAIRQAVMDSGNPDLFDALQALNMSLSPDTRLGHYFIGSGSSLPLFDTEGEDSNFAKIEAFAKEQGIA